MAKSETAVKVSQFSLQGRVIGFVGKAEKPAKLLWVETSEGERFIKLSKKLRGSLSLQGSLVAGDCVEISGERKFKPKTGEMKFKAYQVESKACDQQQRLLELDSNEVLEHVCKPDKNHQKKKEKQPITAPPKAKACVMVCQKSSCRKRGASDVCQAITDSLRERGLEEHVTIKPTGCMKQCKKGPVLVLMPDKSRYTKVASQEVSTLVEEHFACKLRVQNN